MSNAERIASSQFSALGVVGPERLPPEVVELLTLALRRGATDILLAVDRPPSFRVSATLTPVEELPPPGPDAIVRLAHTLLGAREPAHELVRKHDPPDHRRLPRGPEVKPREGGGLLTVPDDKPSRLPLRPGPPDVKGRRGQE